MSLSPSSKSVVFKYCIYVNSNTVLSYQKNKGETVTCFWILVSIIITFQHIPTKPSLPDHGTENHGRGRIL